MTNSWGRLFGWWKIRVTWILLCAGLNGTTPAQAASSLPAVSVDWNQTVVVSKTTPTLMVEVHPLLRDGRPLSKPAFALIRQLGANYPRYLGWYAWPRLVVAEMDPPSKRKTSWDFAPLDSVLVPFLEATKGREPVIDLSTIPSWMFKTEQPVPYPGNPDQFVNDYTQGTELVDPSGKQLAEYYARVVSWYTQGGFTDELGHHHNSGYHYEIPWWGVLNEPDTEHTINPEQYTLLYDVIVTAIRQVSPRTRFVGLGLSDVGAKKPEYFEYFLDPKNHRPGIPIDAVAYHFYAIPSPAQTLESWQYTMFDQADGFLNAVTMVESIRKRLSPLTRVNLDELGIVLPQYPLPGSAEHTVPPAYWNLSGALFAYEYIELARQGIDVIAASQLLGLPKPNPGVVDPIAIGLYNSICLIDETTGQPNARFRVLQLLNENFSPGERLVFTSYNDVSGLPRLADVAIQGFVTAKGKKLLVINKRATMIDVSVGSIGRVSQIEVVDVESGSGLARTEKVQDRTLHLKPFAVAVVTVQ